MAIQISFCENGDTATVFYFVNQERAQLLCNNDDNTVFFAYKERHKGSQRIQFTVTSLNLETRCGEHVDEFNLLLNSPPYPNVPT